MTRDQIPFSPPAIGEEEVEAVAEALRSGWLSRGPLVSRFEEEFAGYVGAEDALAVNSCTSALHLALIAAGVTPGDEVILSTLTFCSAANVIVHLGAKPVFVDIDPATLNIKPELVEAALSDRTRAIMPVHFAGLPADMLAIEEIARRRGVAVIEDAAHSLPARRPHGGLIGSGENLVAFSFYATKNLTTGEGGMLVGPSEKVSRVRALALHGMSKDSWNRYGKGGSWFYEVGCPGFKYNLTDPAAAMGLVQLRKLESFAKRRLELAQYYCQRLEGVNFVESPPQILTDAHARHLFVVQLELAELSLDRAEFINEMASHGIACSVHFIPLHLQPAYRHVSSVREGTFGAASAYFERCMSLPFHPRLTNEEAERVMNTVARIAQNGARL